MLRVYNVCFEWIYKPKRYLGLVITMVVMIHIYMYAGVEMLGATNVYAHTHFIYV